MEVSYTQIEGMVIERKYDASDRTTSYLIAEADLDDEGDYWNAAPTQGGWRPVTDQDRAWLRAEYGIDLR